MSVILFKNALKVGAMMALLSTGAATAAYAQSVLGADAVTCFKTPAQAAQALKNIEKSIDPLTGVESDVVSVDLLDMYEAKNNPFGARLLNPSGKNYQQIFDMILAKIKEKSGVYYSFNVLYKGLVQHSVSSPGGVKNVDDSAETIVLPGNCALIQLAVQERGSQRELQSFTVNTRLFSALSERDKAAFLVHEVIYAIELHVDKYLSDSSSTRKRVRSLFTEGDKNSIANALAGIEVVINVDREAKVVGSTQIFNVFGSSVEGALVLNAKTEGHEDAWQFVNYAAVDISVRGTTIKAAEGTMLISHQKKVRLLNAEEDFELDGYKVAAGAVFFHDNEKLWGFRGAEDQVVQGYPIMKSSEIRFDEDGNVGGWIKLSRSFEQNGIGLDRGAIIFVANGKILAIGDVESIRYRGAELRVNSSLALHENGTIASGNLARPSEIQGIKCSGWVKFYANGNLKSCATANSQWKGLVFEGDLELFENGVIKKGRLKNGTTHFVQSSDNKRIYYQTYQNYRLLVLDITEVEFYTNGQIKSAAFLNDQKFGKVSCEGAVASYNRQGLATARDLNWGSLRYRVELSPSGAVTECRRK